MVSTASMSMVQRALLVVGGAAAVRARVKDGGALTSHVMARRMHDATESRARSADRGGTSVDAAEVDKFAAYARGTRTGGGGRNAWWDARPGSPTAALHSMNAARGRFTRDVFCDQFRRDAGEMEPLSGISVLDVGCGGGIFSESIARMGADVTGIDAASESIAAAQAHMRSYGMRDPFRRRLQYQCATAEAVLAERGAACYDAVVSIEVVEHVADVEAFMATLCSLLRPGGVIVMSTMNRTPAAFALAVVAAERVLGWLPRGTHDWDKFLSPREMAMLWNRGGVSMVEAAGMEPELRAVRSLAEPPREWKLTDRLSVNYIAAGVKATTQGQQQNQRDGDADHAR